MPCRTAYVLYECRGCAAVDFAPEVEHQSRSCGPADVVELLLEPVSDRYDDLCDLPPLADSPRVGTAEYRLRRSDPLR